MLLAYSQNFKNTATLLNYFWLLSSRFLFGSILIVNPNVASLLATPIFLKDNYY